jgi:endo-1,4-beta-D-glucanase Y
MIIMTLMAGTGSYAEPDAKKYFDGMYAFFRNHPSRLCSEFMSWQVLTGEVSNYNSASDGDLDIAYALILAHHQWGSSGGINYLQEAKDMITQLEDRLLMNNRMMLGDWWDEYSSTENQWDTRPSDWMTDHFHLFNKETGVGTWNTIANEAFNLIKTITDGYSSSTGLMPDFVTSSPAQPAGPNFIEGPNDGNYYYNACRFPLRMAADYAHYGTVAAKNACNKILDWIIQKTGGEPYDEIKIGYKLDGTELSADTDMAYFCPMMAGAIVDKGTNNLDYQKFLDKGWNVIQSDNEPIESYSASLRLLSQLLIGGNWWSPNITPIEYEPNISSLKDDIQLTSPAHGKSITVTYTLTRPSIVKMKIVNVQGKVVTRIAIPQQGTGTHSLTADLGTSGLSSGIYFVHMALGEKRVSRQFRVVK